MTVTISMSDTSAVYIGGAWQAAAGPDRIAVRNPVTERVIAEIPVATAADVDVACRAAADALATRAAVSPSERAVAYRAISEGLDARADDLADLVTADLGMPRGFSRTVQVGLAVADFANPGRCGRAARL
jgi:aldehyde dehydrogenase (NAD+)